MKQILVICALVALVGGCGGKKTEPKQQAEANATVTPKPEAVSVVTVTIADPIVEKGIRLFLGKTIGKLTEADLEECKGLNLNDPHFTDTGLKEVAKLQKLTFLDLQNTKITDAGLKEVVKLKRLESLWLLGTKVTPVGVAELQKALPKCKIFGP